MAQASSKSTKTMQTVISTNPSTDEDDLSGALRHAVSALFAHPSRVQLGVSNFVKCRLHDTLGVAGFSKGQTIQLVLLMQEIGLVQKLHKEGSLFTWMIIDPDFMDIILHEDVINAGLVRLFDRNALLRQASALRKKVVKLEANKQVSHLFRFPEATTAKGLKGLQFDLQEERDRVNELEAQVSLLRQSLAIARSAAVPDAAALP